MVDRVLFLISAGNHMDGVRFGDSCMSNKQGNCTSEASVILLVCDLITAMGLTPLTLHPQTKQVKLVNISERTRAKSLKVFKKSHINSHSLT